MIILCLVSFSSPPSPPPRLPPPPPPTLPRSRPFFSVLLFLLILLLPSGMAVIYLATLRRQHFLVLDLFSSSVLLFLLILLLPSGMAVIYLAILLRQHFLVLDPFFCSPLPPHPSYPIGSGHYLSCHPPPPSEIITVFKNISIDHTTSHEK